MIVRILFWAALAGAVLQGAAWASDAPAEDFAAADVDTAVSLVQQSKLAAYRQALARYGAAVKAAPDDPAIAVARCEFVARFTDSESGDYIESSFDDQASCGEALAETWPEAPAALLYAFEQDWSAEAKEQGERLLEGAADWPQDLRRRLAAKLAAQYADTNKTRAGELALMAATLGDGDHVPDAVRYLAKRGKNEQAAALLRDARPAEYGWSASRRVEAALDLDDRQAALRELRRYGRDPGIDPVIAASAELRAGRIADARTRLRNEKGDGPKLRAARFRAAMAAEDWRAAAAEVKIGEWSDFAANVGRFAVLATSAPSTLLSMPMLLILLVLLVAIGFLALAPGIVMLPVHYRGLVRRLRGKPPLRLFDSVGLRHAWLAMAVFLIAPMAALGLVEPQSLSEMLSSGTLPRSQALFRMMFWSTLSGALLLSPLLYRFGREGGFGDARALRAWWRVLLAWAAVLCVAAAIAAWHRFMGNDTQTAQVEMVNSLVNSGRTGWQTLLAFALVAGMVPVFEEFVFRGVILGGMTRHIGFGWSNALQALLFALVHDDVPRFLFYFAMGLLAGWLVKSTRALSPAIALHVLLNAFAFVVAHQN